VLLELRVVMELQVVVGLQLVMVMMALQVVMGFLVVMEGIGHLAEFYPEQQVLHDERLAAFRDTSRP
jgi:hypothetical protein